MDNPSDNQMKSTDHVEKSSANAVRRRMLVGGGGVFLAVQARTSLGQVICQSPSVMLSGNTSPQPSGGPSACSGGRSPGFWRNPQHFPAWIGAKPADLIDVAPCPTGLGGMGPENISWQGTLVKPVFGWAAVKLLSPYSYTDAGGSVITIQPEEWGLWAVLAFPKDAGIQEGHLLWHLIAAYLNSLAFPDYALTTAQVVQAGEQLLDTGLWCPGVDCTAGTMTDEEFIAYVSGMYDINADLEIPLCKAS